MRDFVCGVVRTRKVERDDSTSFRSTKSAFYVVCTHPISPEISKHVQQKTRTDGGCRHLSISLPIPQSFLLSSKSENVSQFHLEYHDHTLQPHLKAMIQYCESKEGFTITTRTEPLGMREQTGGSRELSPFVLRAYQFFLKVRKKIGYMASLN